MFCRKCGTPNADNAIQCSQCGESLQAAAIPQQSYTAAPDIPTRLAPAILVTLFCCLPFGIVSIVYAAQVSAKISAGDFHGAMDCSKKATTWCWLAFWCGLIPMVLYLGIMIIAGIMGATHQATFR
jgi:hypothetical protein